MIRRRALVIATSLSLLAGAAFAQGVDHDQFKRSTLSAQSAALAAHATEVYAKRPRKFGDPVYDAATPHWVVPAVYTGAMRPLAPDERKYVAAFFKSVGVDQAAKDFGTAMLFQAEGRTYWLPVEAPIVPYFAKELRRGQKIDLYLIQSGGTRRTSGWEWLFLVLDFQKPEAGR